MSQVTRRRIGEIQRAIFQVLANEPQGLQVQEVLQRAETLCPPTPFENEDYPNQPGVRRYPKMQRFSTITSVKAGWLVKQQGTWWLTDAGREALSTYTNPVEFEQEAIKGYQAWKAEQPVAEFDAIEEAEDADAARLEAFSQERAQGAWLVRGANVSGTSVLGRWFKEGYCSIQWAELPEIAPKTARSEIAKLVKQYLPDATAVSQGLSVGILNRFLNEMNVGDLVVTVDGPRVYVGEVAGEPTYTGEKLVTRQRAVSWKNVENPFLRSDLPSDAADGLRGQLTLSDLSAHLADFAALAGIEIGLPGIPLPDAVVPEPDQGLADKLMMPLPWLRETVDLLNDKRQIVLYGPPGTGKTYLAQELCKALVETAGGEYEVVQFHPSYAYEDFFEGLRPRLQQDGSGSVAFDLVHGPLRRMAARAAENPASPYVLIIDEINRANLAKVFGELYFLLEYRGTSVALQYSDEAFSLPRNLYIIGTMNTADRSIALVDAAMRRRFYFQGLFPTAPPVAGLLGRWLSRHALPAEAAALLTELNTSIGDPDFAIGPSYLMSKRIAEPGGLDRIWQTAILPLLAEHYFGEGRDITAEFGLTTLRSRLTPIADGPEVDSVEAGTVHSGGSDMSDQP
ncbi:AAA family ATPase [Nocardioides sp. GXQ0305]|uniref:AAA family ATPase n=1 Tax=Nocardioides sp. GXQ0305 TaxID=3423912 RepID=UPI003D7E9C29